jgi:hypothetical protein
MLHFSTEAVHIFLWEVAPMYEMLSGYDINTPWVGWRVECNETFAIGQLVTCSSFSIDPYSYMEHEDVESVL